MDTLRKMLPENVLTRMRNGQALLYDEFPSVTILFSHIHDFDAVTERLSGTDMHVHAHTHARMLTYASDWAIRMRMACVRDSHRAA